MSGSGAQAVGGHPENPMPGMGAADLEAGWRLSGIADDGRVVSVLFGETALRRAYPGLTLGRHPALCDLVVDDPSISRRHLRLCREGDVVLAEDLNSLNGTAVEHEDLRPFEPVPVSEGQVLVVGGVALTLERLDDGERRTRDETGEISRRPRTASASVDDEPAGSTGEPAEPRFQVATTWRHEAGRALLRLALTASTLGLYGFWGRTRQRRRLWGAVRFAGTPFAYDGTGMDLLCGFLGAAGIAIPVAVTVFLTATILGETRPAAAFGVIAAGLVLGIFGLQTALYRSARYRITHTLWRGVAFRLSGSAAGYGLRRTAGLVATLATAGIACPWVRLASLRDRIGRLGFGDGGFHTGANAAPLLLPWSLTLATLALPLLAFAALNTDAITQVLATAAPLSTGAAPAPLTAPWLPALAGLAALPYAWYRAEEWRDVVNHLRFTGADPATGAALARADARTAPVVAITAVGLIAAAALTTAMVLAGVHASVTGPWIAAAAPLEVVLVFAALAGASVVIVVEVWIDPVLLAHLAATTSFDRTEPFTAAATAARAHLATAARAHLAGGG